MATQECPASRIGLHDKVDESRRESVARNGRKKITVADVVECCGWSRDRSMPSADRDVYANGSRMTYRGEYIEHPGTEQACAAWITSLKAEWTRRRTAANISSRSSIPGWSSK